MKILFSPSEGKSSGGEHPPLGPESFIFPELFETRMRPARHYNGYVAAASDADLQKLFGTKDQDTIRHYRNDLFSQPTKKAVERYEGVAYDYLGYPSLDEAARDYIDQNVIIFSNLFGPIQACDKIPDYKLKQGAKLPDLAIESYFKTHFSQPLDRFLEDDIIDLRAGFYEKFYTLKGEYLTFKFIKGGKVVSHWAKAYRGIVLKELAKGRIETIDAFMKMPIEGLNLVDIKTVKNKKEILFEITV